MGVTEADRRRFDYAATCLRDFTRPLVAQVLWTHTEGIEKDVRTLLHDRDASIKLYVARDGVRVRQRLDEILGSYRRSPDLAALLAGFRLMFVPADFDADKLSDQAWMANYLKGAVSQDVLFNIVFGNLSAQVFEIFADHGGPFGLKFAILEEISRNGLDHTPTFTQRLGYKTSGPIREAIAMLNASRLVRRLESAVYCIPTTRGRALLDLTRLMLFEAKTRDEWSPEAAHILGLLGLPTDRFYRASELTASEALQDPRLAGFLLSARFCGREFGRDLLADVNEAAPQFYSELDIDRFIEIPTRAPLTMHDFVS